MGEQFMYSCTNCGKVHLVDCGWFFRSPATAEAVLAGEYGKRAKADFERHPGTSAMFSYDVFRCTCGYARSKRVMRIFADDQAPWSQDPGRGIVWDNARCRCARCGKDMHIVDEPPRRIRCTCGKWTGERVCSLMFD